LELVLLLLLGLLGVLLGIIGGLLGVGGGIIVIPVLVLGLNFESRVAVGTSLPVVLFTALSGTAAYYRQRRIDWKTGVLAATATVPGAAIGGYLTTYFSSRIIAITFGFTLLIVAGIMLRRSLSASNQKKPLTTNVAKAVVSGRGWSRSIVDSTGNIFEYYTRIHWGLPLLFLGGLASGFLGIGGGLIVVPILAAIGLPIQLAVATSMLTMIFTAISGISTHALLGNIQINYSIPLVIGTVLGAQIGARTARRLKSVRLVQVFAVFAMVMGILLISTRL
jgi:uncharacterized membrane protein YfcA